MVEIGFDPVIVQVGSFILGWHGIFTALAVGVAILYGLKRAERAGLDRSSVEGGIAWAILAGFIGARVFHVLDHLDYFAANPLEALLIWQGGMAAYGGFIGGVVGGAIYAARVKLPVWRVLDVAAPAMLVGQIIGRCGCLANGDAWGAPTNCQCGVVYSHPHASIPSDLIDVPTHPYPAYEMVALAVLLFVLLQRSKGSSPAGRLFLLTVMGYSVVRFVLTFVRQETVVLVGLQEAQVVALITAAIALAALVKLRRQPVATLTI